MSLTCIFIVGPPPLYASQLDAACARHLEFQAYSTLSSSRLSRLNYSHVSIHEQEVIYEASATQREKS